MAKKIQQTVQQMQEPCSSSTLSMSERFSKNFKCDCGKKYSSHSGVLNHIKKKHKTNEENYRNMIVQPNKEQQCTQANCGFRLSDIDYNQREMSYLTMVDDCFRFIKDEVESKGDDFNCMLRSKLLDSDEQIQIDCFDLELELKTQTKRQRIINQQLNSLKNEYNIRDINSIIKDACEFKAIKILLFKLEMISSLTKYFQNDFAAKIQLQLEIFASLKRSNNSDLNKLLKIGESKLWGEYKRMTPILWNYYKNWSQQIKIKIQVNPTDI